MAWTAQLPFYLIHRKQLRPSSKGMPDGRLMMPYRDESSSCSCASAEFRSGRPLFSVQCMRMPFLGPDRINLVEAGK